MWLTPNILYDELTKAGISAEIKGKSDFRINGVRNFYDGCQINKDYLYFFKDDTQIDQFEEEMCSALVNIELAQKINTDSCVIQCFGDEKIVFEIIQNSFHKFNDWERRLYECLALGKTLDDLISASSGIFENPIIIDDPRFRTLAHSTDFELSRFHDNEWKYILEHSFHSPDYVKNVLNSPEFQENFESSDKLFYHKYDFLVHSGIFGTLRFDNEILGHFSLIELGSSLTPGMLNICSFFCKFLSISLSNETNIQLPGISHPSDGLILDILNNRIPDEQMLDIAYQHAGLPQKGNYLVVVIVPNPKNTGNMFMLSRVINQFSPQVVDGCIVADKKHIAIVFYNVTCSPKEKLPLVVDEEFLSYANLNIGYSLRFHSVKALSYHYQQAISAIDIGEKIQTSKNIYFYEDILTYDLLEKYSTPEHRNALCHDAIRILSEYDQKKKSSLLSTLSVLLKHHDDTVMAAKELFLHRNSLYYRRNQIIKLTGVDLQDTVTREHLSISLQIYEMSNW